MSNDPALDIRELSFAYGRKPALDGISFTVPAGRFTALLGPNGAGKSTLFALLTRLYEARQGSIRILGRDLSREPSLALARMGVVFQQPTLDLDLSVAQNLRYFAALHGIGRAEAESRIEAELTRLGMIDQAGDKVRKLSGGQRRRAEIARALLHRPALLLLDEPTVGLDLPSRRALIRHVHELCREDGLAVLWATHLIDEIDENSDRVVVLHRGKMQGCGDVAEVKNQTGANSVSQLYDRLTGAAACAG